MSIIKQYQQIDPGPKRRKLSHSPDEDAHSNGDEADESGSDAVASNGAQVQHHGNRARNISTATSLRRHPGATSLLRQGGAGSSSVLAVQLDELLQTQTPKYDSRLAKLRPTVDRLDFLVRSIPPTTPTSIGHAGKAMRKAGVMIPFPRPAPSKDSNLKFGYDEPTSIRLSGSLPQGLGVKGSLEINLVLEMPRSLLQEKDYLNLRAFHKRAFYLACVAAALRKDADDDFEVKYALLDDLELLPALRVTPKSQSMQKKSHRETAISISIAFPNGSFPLEKVLPVRNCVRSQSNMEDSQEPTPFYNSCLCMQTSLEKYDGMIADAKVKCPAFSDGCRAGQIWLQQRGFSSNASSGGFGVFEWAVMSALLFRTGGHRGHPLFSDRYNSLQLFKAMLQVLASRDMTESWCLNGKTEVPKADVPVLVDTQTGVNVLYKMSPSSYQNLRHEAQISLEAVNSKQEDNFESTFILRTANLALKSDEVFSMSIPPNGDDLAHEQPDLLHEVYNVLQRGLGDRVSTITLSSASPRPWSTRKACSDSKSLKLQVAVATTPDVASRLVDHGPPADDREACVEFRSFWGDKSELRRFRDGSINESLTWSPDEPVAVQIVRHLLERHFQVSASAISAQPVDLERQMLPVTDGADATDAFKLIMDQFQTLSSTLHQLEGLPLSIRSVSPADAALRSCLITPASLSRSPDPVSILIQFDASTRWPDSLPAIQYTKIAFLIKLSDLLTATSRDLTTRIGLENTATATSGHLNTSFLDITYPSPSRTLSATTFRLRIHHDRELHLLQRALSTKTIPAPLRTTLSSALHIYKRTLALPPHTNALRSLCTHFPPLSPTIRLLQKWLSSHLLLHHIPAEAIEIIAASIFLRPYPWSVPGSATTAFLRCLHFLSRWNWADEPLIVDLGLAQDMSASMREEIRVGFEAWRKLDPGWNQVTWYIGTSLDLTGVVWTRGRVERVVAGRVGQLARAGLEVVGTGGLRVREWGSLFVGDVREFDFLLGLRSGVVRGARGRGREGEGFKNLQLAEQVGMEEVGFDPVAMYVEDLEKAFGSVAMFFYDEEGGKVIAGLWRPSVRGQREWRVRIGWSTKLVGKSVADEHHKEGAEEKVMSEANLRGMLKEMEMMGEGIVKSAEMVKA